MPYSNKENNNWLAEKIRAIEPKSILDVGAGAGDLQKIVRVEAQSSCTLDAIEVWEPYILRFKLDEKYDKVFNIDVRSFFDWDYDLVVFGDVLEHMPKADAKFVWERVAKKAKYAIITIPIVHYPQGEEEGNPYEVHHVDDWNTQDVLDFFPGIVEHKQFEVTGAFFAVFDN